MKICSQGSLFHSFMITVLFRCTQKLVTASTSKKKKSVVWLHLPNLIQDKLLSTAYCFCSASSKNTLSKRDRDKPNSYGSGICSQHPEPRITQDGGSQRSSSGDTTKPSHFLPPQAPQRCPLPGASRPASTAASCPAPVLQGRSLHSSWFGPAQAP